jgi:tRNA pseudouridine55 synthase
LKAGRKVATAIDGVLLLDKPSGLTSNAALQRVKRLLGAAKAGHVGTLDPLASGLLPICLGEATKFSGQMLAADKTYDADVLLGATSTTGDIEGDITGRHAVAASLPEIEAASEKFRGDILQVPPMYSALKRAGKPLYAYARAGETVVREPRPVTIHSLAITACALPHIHLSVRCSKGTYIRVLAEDIGAALGCGGLLAGLRRTGVGAYEVSQATSLEVLEGMAPQERLSRLLPPDSLVSHVPILALDDVACRMLVTGRRAAMPDTLAGIFRLYDASGAFLGIGEVGAGELVAVRLMATHAGREIAADNGVQATKNA